MIENIEQVPLFIIKIVDEGKAFYLFQAVLLVVNLKQEKLKFLKKVRSDQNDQIFAQRFA